MTDKIAEINKRHEEGGIGKLPMAALAEAHDDRATLLAEVERLRAALRWYADPANHEPVRTRSSGPDFNVLLVEEPPIAFDGGERARDALAGAP